jgi:tetratricopeptide (TPR) repeat protein
MRGWTLVWQQNPMLTKEGNTAARDYFERALTIDPQNAEAMVGLAYVRIADWVYGWNTGAEDRPAAQMELLTKAIAINPGYAFAYYVKSIALIFEKQYSEAEEAGRTGTTVDPNSAHSFLAMGRAEWPLGRCEESIAHIKEAFRLSPRDLRRGLWHFHLGLAEACRGRLDAAVEELKRAIDLGYRPYVPYAFLAAIQAAKGNDAAAKSALAEARRLNPQLTIKWFKASQPETPAILEGLRKAGLPEE